MQINFWILCASLFAMPILQPTIPDSGLPESIFTDPIPNKTHPARMEVLHIPSNGVEINGVAYLAAGKGPHPTVILCHGWPGNEKNLDLGQAIRRAGWNVVTFNYRGTWGSPGNFRFSQNPEDALAILNFLKKSENSTKLGIDTKQIVVIGHSMGGWVSVMVAGLDKDLMGIVLVSAVNLGLMGLIEREALKKVALNNSETLAGTSPEQMADELIAGKEANNFLTMAPKLIDKPLLILTSEDNLASHTDKLAQEIQKLNGQNITKIHATTDHSWSDKRIFLQSQIINWLHQLSIKFIQKK